MVAATATTNTMLATKRQELLALDTRKKSLLSESEAIVSELTAQQVNGGPPIGIDTPLVDAEGYPRADIDVYRARTLRKRFKEIQTDHKEIERKIDVGLVEIAALAKSESNNNNNNNSNDDGNNNNNGSSIYATTTKQDEDEKTARYAPKPKPKFDPKTGKWVVSNWDGSVSGVENGEMRSFNDLYAPSTAALAANLSRGTGEGSSNDGSGSADAGDVVMGGTRQQTSSAQQQRGVSFQEPQQTTTQHTTPFAIIDEVSPNSPASEAGLLENDILIQFGHVNSTNHNNFRAIAELVPTVAGENKSITVKVRRRSTELGGIVEVIKTEVVELKPRTWAGRGLLGCHITPYTE